MAIRYKDVEMLGDAIDSFGRSQVEKKARAQREREREDRRAMEQEAMNFRREQEGNQTAYQNQNLQLQREGIAAQAQRYKNQDAREERMDKAYGQRTELELAKAEASGRAAQQKDASAKFKKFMDWMSSGVKSGIIPADKANAQVKNALSNLTDEQKAALGDNPWLNTEGDYFQAPATRPSERIVDPANGEIIYKENGQMVKGGTDPYIKQKAEDAARSRLAQEAKGLTNAAPASVTAPAQTLQTQPQPVSPAAPADPKTAEIDAYLSRRKALGGAPNVGQPVAPAQPAPVAPGPQQGAMHGVAKPQNAAEFNRLPRGVKFINPADGKIYQKK